MPTNQLFPKRFDAITLMSTSYTENQTSKEGSFGSLTVLMTGETKELDQAEVFIKEQGVGIEVIHRG